MAFGPFGKIFRACSGAGCEIVFKVMRCTIVVFEFMVGSKEYLSAIDTSTTPYNNTTTKL